MALASPISRKSQPLASHGKPHPGHLMTEAEFMEWIDEETRAEWVDGEVVMMAPANLDHADFSWWLHSVVKLFVNRHQLGTVFGTDVLVRFPRQRRRRLPDVLFLSRQRSAILESTFINGAPDLMMEVVSPDSVARDWRDKYLEYERAGVREYWVIDRRAARVEAYALGKSGKYRAIDAVSGQIASTVIKGFYLRLAWLLSPEPPDLLEVLRELGVK